MQNETYIIIGVAPFVAIVVACIIIKLVLFFSKNKKTYNMSIFEKEIDEIENEILKNFVKYYLQKVPNNFWIMPASTSGKYHPQYALGKGGLIRHTKAAVKISLSLLPLEMYSSIVNKRDQIITALILHDTVKTGINNEQHTQSLHPLYACELISQVYKEYVSQISVEDAAILEEMINDIQQMIASHMGQWNTDKKGNEILPKPITEKEKFVHLCDYLASRRFLNVDLED